MRVKNGLFIGLLAGCVVMLAWSARAATTFTVTSTGQSAYVVNGANNPTLTLTRGQTYVFNINAPNHPFWITTVRDSLTAQDNAVSNGVTNNGAEVATITFVVPQSAPAVLYYQCGYHDSMGGTLNIVSAPVASVPALTPVWLAAMAALVAGAAAWTLRQRRQRR